jgi:hypothetical protein
MRSPNIDLILSTLNTIDVKPPKILTDAVADRSKIRTAARLATVTYADVAREWVSATLAGKDPLESPTLNRQAIAYLLSTENLTHSTQAIAEERITTALANSEGAILSALKRACDEAGETLTAAHKIIGDLNLNETELIFRKGAPAVAAHTEATRALSIIRTVLSAWGAIASLTGFASSSTEAIDRLADLPLETRDRLRRNGDAWDIVKAGAPIDLAITSETVKARRQRHTDESKQQVTANADAWTLQARRAQGAGRSLVALVP